MRMPLPKSLIQMLSNQMAGWTMELNSFLIQMLSSLRTGKGVDSVCELHLILLYELVIPSIAGMRKKMELGNLQ